MKLKDRVIKKLLDIGKKHRILVYPTLALVAVITAMSHMIYWGKGNGKKVVASVMIMTLLITQSLFLTSSANVPGDDGSQYSEGTASPTDGTYVSDDGTGSTSPDGANTTSGAGTEDFIALTADEEVTSDPVFKLYRVDENGQAWSIADANALFTVNSTSSTELVVTVPTTAQVKNSLYGDQATYFTVNSVYYEGSGDVSGTQVTLPISSDNKYSFYFKSTRTSYPIIINGYGEMPTKTIVYDISGQNPTEGDINPSFTYTVGDAATYNAYTYGLVFSGLQTGSSDTTVMNPGTSWSSGSQATITPSSEGISAINLYPTWTGMVFPITYQIADPVNDAHITVTGDATKSEYYEYGTEISLWSADKAVGWAENDGYELVGWTDGTTPYYFSQGPYDSSNFATNRSTVDDFVTSDNNGGFGDRNVDGKTLTGIWQYKNITIVAANYGEATVTTTDSGVQIAGTYGDTVNCEISAVYSTGETGEEFRYTMDQADKDRLRATYGLSVTENLDSNNNVKSYTIAGVIGGITTGDSVTFTITDNNKPVGADTSSHSITIVADKRVITVDPASIMNKNNNGKPNKTYDGTTDIEVYTSASVLNKKDGDDVSVTFDSAATLDNSNAGKEKAVTLSNVTLTGAKKDMYILQNLSSENKLIVEDVAQVDPKLVNITVSLADDDNVVLFGESNPNYTLSLDSSMLTAADKLNYDALSNDAERMAFMKAYIGFTGFSVNRSLYSPVGTYTITPQFASEGYNYSVGAAGLIKEFEVKREAGDAYYSLVGNPVDPVGGYYKSVTVTPANGYDKIRLIKSDESDITADMTQGEAEALFSNAIELTEDMTNGTIQFQMLNSTTGAITYPVEVTGINIDTTGPELVSYSVSPEIRYFNEFGFGSYYHSQEIDGAVVESVTITFEYKADDSRCQTIRYYFADENGNQKEDFAGEITVMKDMTTGNYVGSITIGTGASGQLIVYAIDETGNSSTQSKVKLQEVVEFIKDAENSDNYYEWMVENVISASDIVVTELDGDTATAGIWNNGVNLTVNAIDEDSGVWKLVWSITDPAGDVTTVEDVLNDGTHDVDSVVYATKYGKITQYNFQHTIVGEELSVGDYYVSATMYDNAGNSIALTEKGPYKIDPHAPRVDCEDYEGTPDEYMSGVELNFTVTEPEDESGVVSVKLYHETEEDDNLLKSWGAEDGYTYSVTDNGTYIIVATDLAGNVTRETVSFNKISNVIPNAPILTANGKVGNDNWFIEEIPTVTLNTTDVTSDGVPVTTYYRITTGTKEIEKTVDGTETKFDITFEGDVLVEAWSESAAGCVSDVATLKLKIDLEAPKAYITEATVNEAGNPVINFKAEDEISGVDADEVYVNGERIEVVDEDGFISGSFVVENAVDYVITVADKAGNISDEMEFEPLTIKSGEVTDITATGAYIEAQIVQGTYPIADCYIEYKKSTDTVYERCLANKYSEAYGYRLEQTFRNLDSDTVYNYRIYAVTKSSKEVRVLEGSFRTSDNKSTATVYGSVTYDSEIPDNYKTYPIYVALYEANTVVAGMKLNTEDEYDYMFKSVPDGTYRVVATNGMLTEVAAVTVKDGGISYPVDYATNGGINFILDGLNTNVVIEDNVINLSADGLEKVYNTALYNGNVTDEDLAVVAAGGTIDITLHANYIDVSDLNQTTQSIFTDKIGTNGKIERYIELYVIKEVRDMDGNLVNGTPTNITRLAEPLTISFPLEELSGQEIYVASLHGSDSNYAFYTWTDDSEITISESFVTITTDKFSVYALYRLLEQPKEYTVKWVDGNGNIMKTEVVKAGESATPPTELPTKKETTKYKYTFSGWDTDYTSIKKDTIISAWFTVTEKNNSNANNQGSNGNNQSNSSGGNANDISKNPVNQPYMGSGISPQTGDETPILAMAALMLVSAMGIAVVNKRKKED